MFSKKKNLIVLLAVLIFTAVLLLPQIVQAGLINDALINISSWIANQIIYVVGQLLLIAINILIKVASFNDFINANIVNIGWVIIRDLANMAIVIALMIIAFYTVLNKESYEYKKMLPKLILAAILVNFSKLIAGVMIDLGQVVMMTFVHAFEGIAAGNLTYGFGLQDMMSVRNAAEGAGMGAEISDWTVFGALVLGVIMVTVALGVVVTMAVMLLVRVVVLWLLIIFSPIAYVAGLIPGGQKYTSQWWGSFGKYIIFGPVLAFLFWLSMTVLSQVTTQNRLMSLSLQSQEYLAGGTASSETYAYFASQVSSPQRVFDYMVTVALLIMCMIFAKQAGVIGSQFASNTFNKMQGAGKWIARRPQVLGRKGLERAKTSYAGEGVRALAQRGRTSWAGKKVGLDKKYSEEQAAKRRAIMTEGLGGKRGEGAIRSFQHQQAMVKQKEMEEKGLLEGGEDALRKLLHSKISDNKMDEARAVMMKIASDKGANLRKDDYDKYEKAQGVTRNSGTRKEKDMMMYFEGLSATQKASGDAMAKYKNDVTRDSDGNLVYADKVAQVKKDFSEKREADYNNVGIFKAFDENLPEFREILNQLDEKTNMHDLGTGGRDGYAKILQKTLARHYDKNDDFDLEQLEGAGSTEKYAKLLQRMHAKKFVQGTGEAIIDVDKAERGGDKQHVTAGNEKFTKKTGLTVDEHGKIDMTQRSPAVLDKLAKENKDKKVKKEREDRVFAREDKDLTEVDRQVDANVVSPLMADNKIQANVYKAVSKGRNNKNHVAYVTDVVDKIKDLDREMRSQATGRGDSEIVDPESGNALSHVKLYEKSNLGKNMDYIKNNFDSANFKNLSADEQKKARENLENRLDSLNFDVQRAGKKKTKKSKKDRVLENRTVNRTSLGQVVSAAKNLQTAEVSGKERQKMINNILKNVEKAKEHSEEHNPNNEFNSGLKDLLTESEGFGPNTSKSDLDTFINNANALLSQVQAK